MANHCGIFLVFLLGAICHGAPIDQGNVTFGDGEFAMPDSQNLIDTMLAYIDAENALLTDIVDEGADLYDKAEAELSDGEELTEDRIEEINGTDADVALNIALNEGEDGVQEVLAQELASLDGDVVRNKTMQVINSEEGFRVIYEDNNIGADISLGNETEKMVTAPLEDVLQDLVQDILDTVE